ncbi:MAG TPA: cellulose binding domain-containing protein, partial [Polyangium sp.]|nr:cellulose binding domain-containing protein [Polyangium sp.]
SSPSRSPRSPSHPPPPAGGVTVIGGTATVTITPNSSWNGGYCKNVSLKNTDTKSITWTLRIPKEGTLYNSWNVVPKVEGSEFVFNGVSWNSTLAIGQSADFGYCVNL